MAELVVDPLEVVEIAEQQRVREALLEAAGLPVQLGQALLERVAVEEAGQRVEGRATPVGAIGLDQRPGEDHGAGDQRRGGDQGLAVFERGARIGQDRAGDEQRGDEEGAEDHAAGLEAEAEGDRWQREPDQDGAGRLAGDEHGGGEQDRQRRPGAGDPDRRMGAVTHEAVGDEEAGEAEAERNDPPPADLRAAEGEGDGEDREAGGAVGTDPQLHVEQALTAGLVVDRDQGLGALGAMAAGRLVVDRLRRPVHPASSAPGRTWL